MRGLGDSRWERTPETREREIGRVPERGGHRREIDPRRDRVGMETRIAGAVADIAMYRVAARKDIVADHFGGHPYAAARGIQAMVRRGWVREHEAAGPQGQPFKVLTVGPEGAAKAREYAAGRGLDPGQRTWPGLVRKSELRHDAAIYRAGRDEARALEARGARVTRIRIDAELKSDVARATERARIEGGREAADRARREEAAALHLPVSESGAVLYPDVQLEYAEADGERGRVNIEVVTEEYRGSEIAAKAAAGFQMHGSSAQAVALIARALGRSSGGGGAGGGRGKSRGVMEL